MQKVGYKYQAFVEKRHEQLKTAQHIVPVNFKTPERIEAYLLMYFLALRLHALIERQIRLAMKQRGIRTISLYPENRPCRAPTAGKVLPLFQPLRRHQLFQRGQPIKTFWDPLSDIQRTVLGLLGVPSAEYGQGVEYSRVDDLNVRKVGWIWPMISRTYASPSPSALRTRIRANRL
ncbi:MAG: hypothetical protein V3V08_22995 [Nannocystaceae bacterium]